MAKQFEEVEDAKRTTQRRLPRAQREVQMIEAAAKLFGKKGYAATSMDDIAEACGVTKPMLYAYFGSKEGLYIAMIERAADYLRGHIARLAPEPNIKRRICQGLNVFLHFAHRYRDGYFVVAGSVSSSRPGSSMIDSLRQQMLALAANDLASFRPEGLSKAKALRLVEPYAHSLIAVGESSPQWWTGNAGLDLAESERTVAKLATAIINLVRQELKAAVP